MSQGTTLATAAVVGAVAGALAGAVIALSPIGDARQGAIPVRIILTQRATCEVRTEPHWLPVRRRDVIEWKVVGPGCDGIDPNKVELQFVGECYTDDKRVTDPGLFVEPAPHIGATIRRTVNSNDEACYRYQVVHGTTVLEDPELEIMQ